MKLSNRSYPHPVVGNADDVHDAEFQATFEFESDKSNFYLSTTVKCSSKTLLKLIAKGKACYTLHIECSNTLFRKTYDFTAEEHKVVLPGTQIHDNVEVNAFVRAVAPLANYAIEGSHEDYSGAQFTISAGDILAVADGRAFDADHDVDPLRRIGSLMVVVRSTKTGDHPMEVDYDGDPNKILILLCEGDFAAYKEMKMVPNLTSHLTTTLVLPVLIEAIHLLKGPEPPDCKWAHVLSQRLEALDIGSAATAIEKAQRLLELPIKRALLSAQAYLARS